MTKTSGYQKEAVSCPVCESTDYEVRMEPQVEELDPRMLYGAASGVRHTQQVVECGNCHMLYENPRLPEEAILEGYRTSQEGGHDSQYDNRVKSFYRMLRKLEKEVPSCPANVLDIGCAGGAFLEAAEQFGYTAYGLEPSENLVDLGKSRGLRITQGTLDDNPFEGQLFELITFWDVIEHIASPRKVLEKAGTLLKPGGLLLINFPDHGTWQARLAGSRFWWFLSVHLHFFTKPTMQTLLEKSGFTLQRFMPYWQSLNFGYLEEIAVKLGVPGTRFCKAMTPQFIQNIPVSYYASQTCALASKPS